MLGSQEALRLVIVGGVAAGASAAARARRVNAFASITLLEKGPAISFANCGLPYHIGGEIKSRDDLLVASPELFRSRFAVDVQLNSEVTSIDRADKSVVVKRANGTVDKLPYDRLILATGAEPFLPPPFEALMRDAQYSNVTTLWSLADMDKVMSALDRQERNDKAHVLVVGGGFVGLELAEQAIHRGAKCTLVERGDQILKSLDAEMVRPLEATLRKRGIDLRLCCSISEIEGKEKLARRVKLDDHTSLDVDCIVVAIGVRPRIQLASAAGLTIGAAGGISVDGWQRTSDPDIFAAGDSVEYFHRILQRPTLMPLAGPANRGGRIAGTIAAGGSCPPMVPVLGTSVLRLFDKTAASSGLTEARCVMESIPYRRVYIQAGNHAGYFPGAQSMTLKLIYSPTDGKVLGIQGVGGEGVDKRIDIAATVMQMGGTVYDMAGLDLAYAPPFGSAKDPIHMAAFVACNDLANSPPVLGPQTDLSEYQVLDVRNDKELAALPLPGAVHIPVDALHTTPLSLDPERPTVVVCHSAKRAHVAACYLKSIGFQKVWNLTGGMAIRKQFEV
jgi:NADPH-dependent 2,4-dienoyl-CoA reductase/sulfur reductase-like enzyme/rhodanese-related sulfurtransferase